MAFEGLVTDKTFEDSFLHFKLRTCFSPSFRSIHVKILTGATEFTLIPYRLHSRENKDSAFTAVLNYPQTQSTVIDAVEKHSISRELILG